AGQGKPRQERRPATVHQNPGHDEHDPEELRVGQGVEEHREDLGRAARACRVVLRQPVASLPSSAIRLRVSWGRAILWCASLGALSFTFLSFVGTPPSLPVALAALLLYLGILV